jgi:hypothetical protein
MIPSLLSTFSRACLCASLFIMIPAHAKRIALVMGNDNYTSVPKLQKAGNDATTMARELRAAGFAVQLHKDLNYRGMVKAVEGFANSITGGDEVVVFFAGHGVQIKNGSYLLPTDIEASNESEVEKTAYELNALTERISEAKPAFSLVMVDACRDNPLKAKGRSVGNTRGLSAVEPPKGQMIVYSASRGQQALDRLSDKDTNPNGVFTREFIVRMKKPGVKIEDLMREVQDSVESLAKSVSHEQRPAIYNEARGNFYFFGSANVQLRPAAPTVLDLSEAQKEDKFWDDAKSAGNKYAFEAYMGLYPNGRYVGLAKANLAKLTSVFTTPITQPLMSPRDVLAGALVGTWSPERCGSNYTYVNRLENESLLGEFRDNGILLSTSIIQFDTVKYLGSFNGMHRVAYRATSESGSNKTQTVVDITIETDFKIRRTVDSTRGGVQLVKDGVLVASNKKVANIVKCELDLTLSPVPPAISSQQPRSQSYGRNQFTGTSYRALSRERNESCNSNSDCLDGLNCEAGICLPN